MARADRTDFVAQVSVVVEVGEEAVTAAGPVGEEQMALFTARATGEMLVALIVRVAVVAKFSRFAATAFGDLVKSECEELAFGAWPSG